MMLIESKVKLRYTAELDFTYEDHGKPYVHSHVELNEKDRVKIKFVDRELKRVVDEEGVITKIYETMGRTSCVMFTLDCSHNFNSKIYNISADSIRMVEVLKDVVDEEFTPNIEWTLNKIKVIKNEEDVTGMLVIPYNRLAPGKVTLIVKDAAEKVLFKEIYTASMANENASFSFTLRDFSEVADKALEAKDETLLIDNEGNYVFRNGDESNPIVIATDRDNDLIIAAGSLISITIIHETEPNRPSENIISEINTTYVVSRKDTVLVTYTEPEQEPVEPPTDIEDPTIPPDDSEEGEGGDNTGTDNPVIDDVTGDYTDPTIPNEGDDNTDTPSTDNPTTPDDNTGGDDGTGTETPEDPSTGENTTPDEGGEDNVTDPDDTGNADSGDSGSDNNGEELTPDDTGTEEPTPEDNTTENEDPVDTPTEGEGTSTEENTGTEEGTTTEDGNSETTEEN